MKKNNIILWIAAFVITFLTIYLSNLLDSDYPLSGTFGIDGKKISYRFEKSHYGNDDFNTIIRTDVNELTGKIFWKSDEDTIWQSVQMEKSNMLLSASIPSLKPEKKLIYFAELHHNDKKYILPDNQKVELTFFGKIPIVINVLEHLLFYIGLIFVVRTGLEYFNDGKNSKKFGVLASIVFLTLIALINPLFLTYKYGFMNSSIPPISRLFLLSDFSIFFLWIVTSVLIFRSEKFKILPLLSAILTIAIVILFR
ncbi:MAG: hypothetical protein EHM44_02810 [Ignavibacteriales bacterium]|nr:MAG: hypothetical protein EHM44_02810 [Ignavibacteriales bacterium]